VRYGFSVSEKFLQIWLLSAIDAVLLINDVFDIFRLLKYWKAISYCVENVMISEYQEDILMLKITSEFHQTIRLNKLYIYRPSYSRLI
jgi:hypothetical protein